MTAKTKDVEERASYGPAMEACRPDEREFVMHVIEGKNFAEAARLSGWGEPDSSANTMARIGYRISHRDRVIAAIAEETRKAVRTEAPRALKAVREILDNYHHKDRARTALAVIERVDPTVQRQEIEITHKTDHEGDALAQLRTLKALNVAHDKLVEVFGQFGLERLEKKLAIEAKANVIDGDYSVIDPDAEILGL